MRDEDHQPVPQDHLSVGQEEATGTLVKGRDNLPGEPDSLS